MKLNTPTTVVSVIIPAYNCAPYISDTITSILSQQTAATIEIIVVDDGSTDETANIVRSFASPVSLLCQENKGVCAARNFGLRHAKGDYVAFVDHDDYWMPNKLENQLAAFRMQPDAGVVFSELIYWNPDESGQHPDPKTYMIESQPNGIDLDFTGWIYHRFLLECCPLTSAALIHRDALTKIGEFDETLPYSEDWDLFLRISLEFKYVKLKEKTVLYRQHPNQGSRMVRPIDYRTRLVERANKKWGLCSRDGRCITEAEFKKQVSSFCTSYGLHHLGGGKGASRILAAKSLAKAWITYPLNWRSAVYLALSCIGWKPNKF